MCKGESIAKSKLNILLESLVSQCTQLIDMNQILFTPGEYDKICAVRSFLGDLDELQLKFHNLGDMAKDLSHFQDAYLEFLKSKSSHPIPQSRGRSINLHIVVEAQDLDDRLRYEYTDRTHLADELCEYIEAMKEVIFSR